MAAPNLISLNSATGKSYFANLTSTANTTLMTVPSNQVYKINNITVANIDATTGYDVTMYIANTTSTVSFAYQITVPAKSSLVLNDKSGQFYLEENYQLQGGTTASNKLSVLISYETLS
jgi:hypothetical protein